MINGLSITDIDQKELIKIGKAIKKEKDDKIAKYPMSYKSEYNEYFPIYFLNFVNNSYKTVGIITSQESIGSDDPSDDSVGERIYFTYRDYNNREIRGQYQIMTHFMNSGKLIPIKEHQMKVGNSIIIFYDPTLTERYWVSLIDVVKRVD